MVKNNGNGTQQTQQHKKKFLEGFLFAGTITAGCEYAGVNRTTFYRWLESCPAFVEEYEKAKEAVTDNLEREAIRRAYNGSDTLLIFLLKGNKPDKYREKTQTEHIGTGEIILRVVYDA